MTEKKEKILQAALELFAKEGYRTTSTVKVAKLAGVSEGLIFRHFTNKEGLLEAIIKEGENKAQALFATLLEQTDPKKLIRSYLELGISMASNSAEADFWKLQFKIKWELEQYGAHKVEPIVQALTQAFEKLGYESPREEAEYLVVWMDGLATHYFLKERFDFESQIALAITKYKL